jgi:hypothetical protein
VVLEVGHPKPLEIDMKYRVIKSTVAAGVIRSVGEVIELSNSEGADLMAYGKVVPHDEVIIENRVELVEIRDPKPRGRRTK